jgi:glycine/D-amino acid oxidase-like deaminating enzyme
METADVLVIGGGMVGPAIGLGLSRAGLAVTVLDEGDGALRAARGNFGLVWFQGKGFGLQRYVEWTRRSAELWPDHAAGLREETGIDVGLAQPGGLDLCLGEDELARRRWRLGQIAQQGGDAGYEVELLDPAQIRELLPGLALGEAVAGASYSRRDGHANPLRLLRATHTALQRAGGRYRPGEQALRIHHSDGTFRVESASGTVFESARLVLAAGHGISRLAPQVGLEVPLRPERGQILVTERVRPLLPMPVATIRQTDEGSLLLGDSHEDTGFDDRTTSETTGAIARRAVAALPALAGLGVVRTWGAIRVLTPDGGPVYAESCSHPGAFVAVCHSGVTLHAVHAGPLAGWIAGGEAPPGFDAFRPERFGAAPSPPA